MTLDELVTQVESGKYGTKNRSELLSALYEIQSNVQFQVDLQRSFNKAFRDKSEICKVNGHRPDQYYLACRVCGKVIKKEWGPLENN